MNRTWALTGLTMLVACGTAFAFQDTEAAGAAAGAAEEGGKMPGSIKGILTGILGGVIAVFIGWGKNKDVKTGTQEKFDFKHAWPTLIIGAIVGLIAHFMDLTPAGLIESVEASPLFAGAVFALEAVWKMIFRHTAPLIRESVDAIKGAGKNPPATPPQK